MFVWLALGAAEAHATHFDFTVSPNPPNQGEVTTFTLQGPTGDIERIRWDLDGDDDFEAAAEDELTVTHVYGSTGPVTVKMRVTDDEGREDIIKSLTVKSPTVNSAPTVDFDFTPAAPVASQEVAFTPTVSDPEGDDVTLAWTFGDGGTSTEPAPTHTYAAAGTYEVKLTATDEHGATAFSSQAITVLDAPGPPPDMGSPSITDPVGGVGTTTPPPTRPVRMRPFPLVRIAGVVLPNGADVRILSVRASRRARIRVRCRGRGCPVRSLTRARASRLVRLRRFERRLRAGTRLELFVTQPGRIGKYTRFLIRAGKPPARIDRCLMPGRARPIRCP